MSRLMFFIVKDVMLNVNMHTMVNVEVHYWW